MTSSHTPEVQMSDQEWRQRLSPEQYQVLRNSATEPAWSGELLHVDDDGVFRCAGCGAALFSTDAKFDSGSGWPSFDRAIAAGTIVEKPDHSHLMVRTEITCAKCGGHLGHVFPDGPTDTGLRYCVNSLALEFDAGADAGAGVEAGAGAEGSTEGSDRAEQSEPAAETGA